jgi:hypothetical protein
VKLRVAVSEIGKLSGRSPSAIAWGNDGFFYIGEAAVEQDGTGGRELRFARLGVAPVSLSPQIRNPLDITRGPANSLLVELGDNTKRYLGVIWFPDEETFIPIERNVFPDEDPSDIHNFYYSETTKRLIATTNERLCATLIEPLLKLPHISAITGRAVKTSLS